MVIFPCNHSDAATASFACEYAVTRNCGLGNLRGGIGEAAFMTGLERNSDVVVMASYAPLFCNANHKRWPVNLINYDTGIIQLPRIPGVDWSTTNNGTGPVLRISYSFQTNDRNDVVRVSYLTKELQAATLGMVQYTRRRAEALPFEVTERIALRNLRK